MDVLSDVLNTIRLQSTVFTQAELAAPWGMHAEPRDHFAFHIVARGPCWLDVEGGAAVQVGPGDVVVLAPQKAHALRDAPNTPTRSFRDMLAAGDFAPVGRPRDVRATTTQLVCGCFRFEEPGSDVLVSALPTVIHTRDLAEQLRPWLAQTIQLLTLEASDERPGTETVVNRLCDAMFVYILRSYLAQTTPRESSWLRGLAEPQIGAALRLIHERPAEAWTVGTLASRVGMSRSAFAERFANVVGVTPMQYLTRWRLQKAAGMLRGGRAGIAEVAARVGYDSEAAFNKAFKRSLGVAPGAYRRSVRRAEEAVA